MKYNFILAAFLPASFPTRVSAQTLVPPAQDQFVELGLEALKQEAPGIRFGIAYVMNMGSPSFVSKIGFDAGLCATGASMSTVAIEPSIPCPSKTFDCGCEGLGTLTTWNSPNVSMLAPDESLC